MNKPVQSLSFKFIITFIINVLFIFFLAFWKNKKAIYVLLHTLFNPLLLHIRSSKVDVLLVDICPSNVLSKRTQKIYLRYRLCRWTTVRNL